MVNMIKDYLKTTIPKMLSDKNRYIKEGIVCYKKLDSYMSVVLAFEEGFDEKEYENGMCLCASLRVNDSSLLVEDWKIIEDDISLSNKPTEREYSGVTNYLVWCAKIYKENRKDV